MTIALSFISALWAQLPSIIDLNVTPGTESSSVTRVYGGEVVDHLGGSVSGKGNSLGDVNGDGLDDVILGAANGGPSGQFRGGEVVVVYGQESLPASAEIDLHSPPGANGETRIYGDAQVSSIGHSVASGDVNGDGVDDVIIGAWDATTPGGSGAGEVVIVYGSASLPSSAEIFLDSIPGTHGETRILGDDENDQLGYDVECGDLNGDGIDDVIIGADSADTPGGTEAGEVVIIYGTPSLHETAEINLNSTQGGTGQTRILGDDARDYFGRSLASGDVDGDGIDDVIVGVQLAGAPVGMWGGQVVVVYGSPALPARAQIDLNTTPGTHGETRIYGDDSQGQAGYTVACGDVNGDGSDDVILSAHRSTAPGGASAGEVVILYGSASLRAIAEVDLNTVHGTHGETRIFGDNALDQLASSLGAGDVNGDGYDDVILGAAWADIPGLVQGGEVFVVFGGDSLPTVIDLNSDEEDVLVLGDNEDDMLGWAIESGGDVNGDGFVDFITSTPFGDHPSLGKDNRSGVGYVIYGDGVASTASVAESTRVGDGTGGSVVPATDFGPSVRCAIDFSDEDMADNGAGGASVTTVTLTRNDTGLNLPSLSEVADVHWEIDTDRVGWSGATVTFRYTDSEIAGLIEGNMVIKQAATAAGPFTQLSTIIDPHRNEATASVNAFGIFAIAEVEPVSDGFNLY